MERKKNRKPLIIRAICAECGVSIDAEHTLLIFDEVQEVPRALSSLKYFYENAPQYAIVAAGSLLGVALLLNYYQQDFSKHATISLVLRLNLVWNSIPMQLAKENKKYIYGQVREGGTCEGF